MSILFANGVSIAPMPGGGISALALIQALALAIGKGGSRDAATDSFSKVKGKPELLGVGRVLGTPVLMTSTLQHVHAIIDSKTYNRIAAEFKAQHLDAIASMLPGDQQQPPPPAYFTAGLTHVTGSSISGRFSAIAASYPDFLQFKTSMEREEGVHFNSDHRQEQLGGAMLKLTYSCYFAGKASWERRKARAPLEPGDFSRPASAGHSIKCDCPASITAFIPMPYARQLGLVKSNPGFGTSSPVTDTVINVKMELGHHGHTPNSQQDLFTLPTDLRCVLEFTLVIPVTTVPNTLIYCMVRLITRQRTLSVAVLTSASWGGWTASTTRRPRSHS